MNRMRALPWEIVLAGSSGLREDRDPELDHVVPAVVLYEGTAGIGRSRQFFECLHGWADALIQPWRVSGDPCLQVPAAGQGRHAEPEACGVVAVFDGSAGWRRLCTAGPHLTLNAKRGRLALAG